MPLAAAISAGASLIGGLLGKKSEDKQQKRQIAFAREEREYNKPINMRARAEEGGFNPLLFVGPGVGNAASGGISGGGSNYMGQAIADAGMLIAEGMRNKSAETKRINQLETQNKELQKKLVQQTIRPPMGGMYQSGGPSIRKPPEPKAVGGPIEPTAAGSDEGTLPATLPILFGGMEIIPSGKNSDADVTEGRYGDIVGPIMGIRAIYDDARHTIENPRLQGAMDAFGNKREYYPHELPTYERATSSAISLAEAAIKTLQGGAGAGALREQLKKALAYAKKNPDEAERVLNPLLQQVRGSDFFK